MASTLLPLAGFTAFFTLLHVLAIANVEPAYARAFKLSRGVAAAVLTALGVAALVDAVPHWRSAFLYAHEADDWMRLGVLCIYGHLLSDFAWMGVGRWRFGVKPRPDLVIHHLLGLLGFGAALLLEVGYALALITMITELMPVTTGIHALGKRIAAPALVDGSERARLHVLVWLRLPLWLTLLTLTVTVLLLGTPGSLLAAYVVAFFGLLGLVSLDVYWIGKCRQHVDFY
jgi:hypothetical protein